MRPVALAVLLFALGGFVTAIAWTDLAAMMRDLGRSAPMVSVSIGAAIALPAGAMLLGIAAMLTVHLVRPEPKPPMRAGWIAILCCLPLMLLLPAGLIVWAGASLPQRGYARCTAVDHAGRYPVSAWARGAANCAAIDGAQP